MWQVEQKMQIQQWLLCGVRMCDVFVCTQSCVCNARSWQTIPLASRELERRIEAMPAAKLLFLVYLPATVPTNLQVRHRPP